MDAATKQLRRQGIKLEPHSFQAGTCPGALAHVWEMFGSLLTVCRPVEMLSPIIIAENLRCLAEVSPRRWEVRLVFKLFLILRDLQDQTKF